MVIKPAPIPDGILPAMRACMTEVRARFDVIADNEVRRWWDEWFRMYCPRTESAVEYMTQLKASEWPYRVPMANHVFNGDCFVITSTWSRSIGSFSVYDPEFEWPEVLAAATNSVMSSHFNPNPPPPRVYVSTDENMRAQLSVWTQKVAPFYVAGEGSLSNWTNAALKIAVRRKVGYSGVEPSSTGAPHLSMRILMHSIIM